MSLSKINYKLISGIILFTIPLALMLFWIKTFNSSDSFTVAKNAYADVIPAFLANAWMNILLLLVSIILFVKSLNSSNKIIVSILICLASLLLLWQFWSLM
ncbi:hypothetical protein [Mesonia sp. K7]|uniref:hypothetical protein n=1 Tax=Mesonia sp. K7 TaxID=2218606 RepID=UPI0011B6A946|nr:hypothetical protein [Mesonia sp. K7]